MRQSTDRSLPTAALLITVLTIALSGCHKKVVEPTEADVAAAQEDARKEMEQARVEARKDVKSAVKVSGGEAANVAAARVTGTFDIAMAQADGDHKVALVKCSLLESASQQTCKDQADAQFQAAAAQAKAMRVASSSRG